MIYDKICEVCGKPFQSDKHYKRLCSKECFCEVRRRCAEQQRGKSYNNIDRVPADIVDIRIIKPIAVFEHLRPPVGSVHKAEKVAMSKYTTIQTYIIRDIGKHGLLVRSDECVEVGGD